MERVRGREGRGGMRLQCSISFSQQQDKWMRKKLKAYLKTTECSEIVL